MVQCNKRYSGLKQAILLFVEQQTLKHFHVGNYSGTRAGRGGCGRDM